MANKVSFRALTMDRVLVRQHAAEKMICHLPTCCVR